MTGRLTVVGATGGTGRAIIRHALAEGHDVVAFARRPEAVGTVHERLRVVAGDVEDVDAVRAAVQGSDAVLSALGIGRSRAATTVYSGGTRTLIDAMRVWGPRRLLCVSTSGLGAGPRDTVPQRLAGGVLRRVLARPYADMARMERAVRSSDLQWTIVRAARLTDGPATGRIRIAADGRLRSGWSVSRADLAAFMVATALGRNHHGSTVEIAR